MNPFIDFPPIIIKALENMPQNIRDSLKPGERQRIALLALWGYSGRSIAKQVGCPLRAAECGAAIGRSLLKSYRQRCEEEMPIKHIDLSETRVLWLGRGRINEPTL